MSRKTKDVSDTQSATKRARTSSSTPTFRSSRAATVVKCPSRRTTIRKTARGRRGHVTESRRALVNEELSDLAVSEPPPPDPGELNYDPENYDLETSVPSLSLKPKRKQQNKTSVRDSMFKFSR
jgi:hypothetical protein